MRHRPRNGVNHLHASGVNRPRLATCFQTCTHRRDQTIAEVTFGVFKRRHNRGRYAVIGKQVPGRDHIAPGRVGPNTQCICPGMDRRCAIRINREYLAIIDERTLVFDVCNSLLRGFALRHEVQRQRSQRRIGDILRRHRADTGACVSATRSHSGRR